jgi:hypothetical protein
MNSLAWNTEISQRLRLMPQLAFGALPIGLMFAAFIPISFITSYLSLGLGIPDDSAVKDQPNGILWLAIFLISMVFLMIVGYLFGWFLNAIILRVVFNWPREKVSDVLLYSKVPTSWLKSTKTVNRKNKRYGSIVLGIFGIAVVGYTLFCFVSGELFFPSKYGKGDYVSGWVMYIIGMIPLTLGIQLSTYFFHNGYRYTNDRAYKVSKIFEKISVWYTLTIVVVVALSAAYSSVA